MKNCQLSTTISVKRMNAGVYYKIYWANLKDQPPYIVSLTPMGLVYAVDFCKSYGTFLPLPASLKDIEKLKLVFSRFFSGKILLQKKSLLKILVFIKCFLKFSLKYLLILLITSSTTILLCN